MCVCLRIFILFINALERNGVFMAISLHFVWGAKIPQWCRKNTQKQHQLQKHIHTNIHSRTRINKHKQINFIYAVLNIVQPPSSIRPVDQSTQEEKEGQLVVVLVAALQQPATIKDQKPKLKYCHYFFGGYCQQWCVCGKQYVTVCVCFCHLLSCPYGINFPIFCFMIFRPVFRSWPFGCVTIIDTTATTTSSHDYKFSSKLEVNVSYFIFIWIYMPSNMCGSRCVTNIW